jgi:DNA topoisomerase-2
MISVSCIGNGKFNGFTVNNKNNRFLLGDFTVTHNCSQRKVLFAVKKRNLTYNKQSLKVAQLGGYVAEHTNYHHGEQNLFETIINMAQDYVGSNNIPLFYRDGMFGTRLVGGKDSASPRYIFTKMESITPLIFREEDDVLLDYVSRSK